MQGAWDTSEVPVTHTFYCAWLKTQVETCVTGTLDKSQAPLRHKWEPGPQTRLANLKKIRFQSFCTCCNQVDK